MTGAIVTDQFRIANAKNFIDSVNNETDSYYMFMGLANPAVTGYGRTDSWNTSPPIPTDNISKLAHTRDTMLFGRKIKSVNIRRIVRRIDWNAGTKYEMYRHDYSVDNLSPVTQSSRLYDSNFYVINSDFKVYICIDNGSSVDNPTGNPSLDEPKFTGLEPSRAGESGDGYVWKYLFTIAPSDIIKFDSTEYIPVPNDWETTTAEDIKVVRDSANSDVNNNQIKKIYISNRGGNYSTPDGGGRCDILGDGTGGEAIIEVNSLGEITNATIANGGQGYTYGIVDLDNFNGLVGTGGGSFAELIPIIPPDKGHGSNIYTELGSDKVLIYVRFDDSSKDFPLDTKFAQIGIIKNPKQFNSNSALTSSDFSGLYSLKLNEDNLTVTIGQEITQTVTDENGNDIKAKGYVASYDSETKVLKYYNDRSLFFGVILTHKDYVGISSDAKLVDFSSTGGPISPIGASIDTNFTGISTTVATRIIDLGVQFQSGVAFPEINKKTGEIIYLDNRTLVSRNPRQKEDIKVILEF